MPVRKNPAYADPYMAKAAENIAGLFAPGDIAGDALKFQGAAAKKLESERLAELFNYAKSPTYTREMADRLGTAAGVYRPDQSYYSVDTGAATTRRGQDVTAQTALATNAADNERALATNANTTRGATIAGLFGKPLSPGEIGQAVPAEVAATVGLPAMSQREGREKPLTEDQVKAAVLRGMDPSLVGQFALTGAGVETIQSPTGPIVQSRAGAVGRPAVPDPAKATPETEISKLIAERERLPAGDPNRRAYTARIDALGRGQQQSAYDKETDEAFAKENAKLAGSAQAARVQLGSLGFMRKLLSNPETQQGFGATASLEIKKAMEAVGMPVGNTTDAEVARALSNKLALYAKNEGGENLMPGALSDSDRPFLQQQVAGLGNTRGANMKLLDYYERVQRRAIDVENLRQGYVEKHGRIDEGFRREVAAWAEANPVFPEGRQNGPGPGPGPARSAASITPITPSSAAPAAAPRPGDVVDGYRFNGGNPADPAAWARAQ